jgi:DNA-nicking Smr family endonuclease
VRVIHGKGLHSKAAAPVLGSIVEQDLRRRSEVLAYASAPPTMGGTGAVLVLLSRRRPNEAIDSA